MNLYLASERIDRADTLIAAREQSRLEDLLVFIDAYAERHAGVGAAAATLDGLPSGWFLRTSRLSKPYVQFQLAEIERVLAAAMGPESDQPTFSDPLLNRLEEALRSLADHIVGTDLTGKVFLEWAQADDGSRGVLLDGSSAMARYLIVDSFGEDKIPPCSGAEEEAWRSAFDNAQRLLRQLLPEAAPHLYGGLAVIVPVVSTSPRMSLSSTPASINGVFLASWVSAKYLAEAMVHEVSHDCLNRINLVEPLFREEGQGYYSPFRSDARPASGLLHGAYSFLNVIHYLFRVYRFEPRLAEWAGVRLDDYLFNTILCTRILAACDELRPAGRDLVSTIALELDEFGKEYELRPTKELLDEKREHFETWAVRAPTACIDLSREAFEDLIANTPVRRDQVAFVHADWRPKFETLSWLRTNYRRTREPVIVRGESLANTKILQGEIEKLSNTEVKVLDAKKNKGYPDTPAKHVSLTAHLENSSDSEIRNNYFLVITNFQKKISKSVWKKDIFFENFWIDGEQTWMFGNASGLEVTLHNDSVNNLHCIIRGKKTFYLSPPEEVFHIKSLGDDYSAGFSAFRPFDNIELAKRSGSFVTANGGDMLYLPRGWWHSVRYDSDCLSISAIDEAID